MSIYAFANLKDTDLEQIKALEGKLGHALVAMKPVDMSPADIEQDDLQAVQDLEERLGVALVAVQH